MTEKTNTSNQSVRARAAYLFLTIFAASGLAPLAHAQVSTSDDAESIEESYRYRIAA